MKIYFRQGCMVLWVLVCAVGCFAVVLPVDAGSPLKRFRRRRRKGASRAMTYCTPHWAKVYATQGPRSLFESHSIKRNSGRLMSRGTHIKGKNSSKTRIWKTFSCKISFQLKPRGSRNSFALLEKYLGR